MTGETNWTPYSVPELAGILDDDLTSAWEQVGAWFSADAMLDDAASKLAEARSGLAAVWPPESSPAAQTFFQVVDALTDSMKKTALAANTNANALSQVLDNHTDTKSKVDGLHSAWTVNQKMAPTDPGEFPNPAQWQSSLNAEAQQHMTAADNVINEYASTLVVPPVIPVPGWIDPVTVIPGQRWHAVVPGGGGGNSASDALAADPAAHRRRSGSPIGPDPPLPGVPILTGGGPPPLAVDPVSRRPGRDCRVFRYRPERRADRGRPSGTGGPGIPVPVIPGAPATPGGGGGSVPGKPRGGGSLAVSRAAAGSCRASPVLGAGRTRRRRSPGVARQRCGRNPGRGRVCGRARSGNRLHQRGGFAASSGGKVLGRDGTLRPGRSSASGPEFGGTEFGDGVGPTAADGRYGRERRVAPGTWTAPGATLSPGEGESSEGSIVGRQFALTAWCRRRGPPAVRVGRRRTPAEARRYHVGHSGGRTQRC